MWTRMNWLLPCRQSSHVLHVLFPTDGRDHLPLFGTQRLILSISAHLQEQVDPSSIRLQRHPRDTKDELTGLEPKPIRIHDRSRDDQDKDNADGLWASSVTVTEPSIVKGNQVQGLQAVSGYVGSSCSTSLY